MLEKLANVFRVPDLRKRILFTLGLLAVYQPAAIPYALFLAAGPALAIPFAMITAWPVLGSFAARVGIGRLPEETTTPSVLSDLALPAIESMSPTPVPNSA